MKTAVKTSVRIHHSSTIFTARAFFQACVTMQGDSAEEEKLTAQFKELFKPYDIMS